MRVVVQQEPFDLGAEANAFAAGDSANGAIVTFTGVVRDLAGGDLDAMVIEHYPGMTEKALTKIAAEALDRGGDPEGEGLAARLMAPYRQLRLGRAR